MTFSEDLRIRFIDNKPQVYDRHQPTQFIESGGSPGSWVFRSPLGHDAYFSSFHRALTYLMDQ